MSKPKNFSFLNMLGLFSGNRESFGFMYNEKKKTKHTTEK